METKVVLVTGGAGFIGSWLADELLKRGHKVITADNLLGGNKRNINSECRFAQVDLRQRSEVSAVMKGVQVIYHLAAYSAEGQSLFSPIAINEINTLPMNNLLVEAVNNQVEKFVYVSSMSVYGSQKPPFRETLPRRPQDPYGVAKAYCETMLEIFARNYGFEYSILRPHNVYGPRQNIADPYRNVLAIWINRIFRAKPPIIYGNGRQRRAFSYIGDVVGPLANSGLADKANGQIINLGSDEVVTINEACKLVIELTGFGSEPRHELARPAEVKDAYCTVDKSTKLLGYNTRHSLRAGLKKMIEWVRDIGPMEPNYLFPLEIVKNAPAIWVERSM